MNKMKKIIFVLAMVVTTVTNGQAKQIKAYRPFAEFNNDTVAYLQYNFVERGEKYVNKALSVLLADCELDILSILHAPNFYNVNVYNESSLYFQDIQSLGRRISQNAENDVNDYIPGIVVTWKVPIYVRRFDEAVPRMERAVWVPYCRDYLSPLVISDIFIKGQSYLELHPPRPAFTDPEHCCAPVPVSINAADRALKEEVLKTFYFPDSTNVSCYGGEDNTNVSKLFHLAKSSYQPYSMLMVNRSGNAYGERYLKDSLFAGGGVHKYTKSPYCSFWFEYMWSKRYAIYTTVPESSYDIYKFTAPTGFDLYNFSSAILGKWSGDVHRSSLRYVYFIGYDGNVYALRGNNISSLVDLYLWKFVESSVRYRGLIYPNYHSSEKVTLKWGFFNGARMQEEFLDCFRRLYSEGEGFTKEDAYNAAFAYVLEDRGAELYRSAPDANNFKRYNTTPVKNAGGEITGFYSTIWQ